MLNIVVAPKDKVANSEKYAKKIVKYLKEEKVEYSIYFSHSLDEMVTNVEELKTDGETDFVLIGDDEAISHFVNEFKDLALIKLGIIPAGKSNDLAHFLELETNPILAIKNILNDKTEAIDYLIVNDRIALNNVSVGAFESALEVYDNYRWKSNTTKRHALLKYGSQFDGIELTLNSKNNINETLNIFELNISNGAYQHGQAISPLSNIKDGLFNLNYIVMDNTIDKKKTLISYYKGDHIYNEQTVQMWINNLKITRDESFNIAIDGKIYSVDELNVSIVEKGLNIYR